MGFWDRVKDKLGLGDDFDRILAVCFPDGEDQFALEVEQLRDLLKQKLSLEETKRVLVHAKILHVESLRYCIREGVHPRQGKDVVLKRLEKRFAETLNPMEVRIVSSFVAEIIAADYLA